MLLREISELDLGILDRERPTDIEIEDEEPDSPRFEVLLKSPDGTLLKKCTFDSAKKLRKAARDAAKIIGARRCALFNAGSRVDRRKRFAEFNLGDTIEFTALPTGGVQQIVASDQAFCALKADGSVFAWGDPDTGGRIPGSLAEKLKGHVEVILACKQGFSALLEDGSVIGWGGMTGSYECDKQTMFVDGEFRPPKQVVTRSATPHDSRRGAFALG